MTRDCPPEAYLHAAVVALVRRLPSPVVLRWNGVLVEPDGTARGDSLDFCIEPACALLGLEEAGTVWTPAAAAGRAALCPMDVVAEHDAWRLTVDGGPVAGAVVSAADVPLPLGTDVTAEPLWTAAGLSQVLRDHLARATRRSDLAVRHDPSVLPLAVRVQLSRSVDATRSHERTAPCTPGPGPPPWMSVPPRRALGLR